MSDTGENIILKNRAARKQRNMIGAAVGATLLAGFGVYEMWPEHNASLKKWNPQFSNLCSTPDGQGEFKGDAAKKHLTRLFTMMRNTGPLGRELATEQTRAGGTYCFDPKADKDKPIDHWLIGNITMVSETMPDAAYINPLLREKINGFWNSATVQPQEFSPVSALLWSRVTRVMPQLALIDAQWQMYTSKEVDNDKHERLAAHLKGWGHAHPELTGALKAYLDAGPATNLDAARKAAFEVLMTDGERLDKGDRNFLGRYISLVGPQQQPEKTVILQDLSKQAVHDLNERVQDSKKMRDPMTTQQEKDAIEARQRTRGAFEYHVTKNERVDGGKNKLTYTFQTLPANTVASKRMSSESLVSVSSLIDGRPFLSNEQAIAFLRNETFRKAYSTEAAAFYQRAVDSAAKYANNDTGTLLMQGGLRPDAVRRMRP